MNTEQLSKKTVEDIILKQDLTVLPSDEKVKYVMMLCERLGIDFAQKPFAIIKFQGQEKLYATKDCTEQLRKIHGVSVTDIKHQLLDDIFAVTVTLQDKYGKVDVATGAVPLVIWDKTLNAERKLTTEEKCNAIMKAETKAKRRGTLSICGLGILDDSERDTMPKHEVYDVAETNVAPTIPQIEPKKEATPRTPKQELNMYLKAVNMRKEKLAELFRMRFDIDIENGETITNEQAQEMINEFALPENCTTEKLVNLIEKYYRKLEKQKKYKMIEEVEQDEKVQSVIETVHGKIIDVAENGEG